MKKLLMAVKRMSFSGFKFRFSFIFLAIFPGRFSARAQRRRLRTFFPPKNRLPMKVADWQRRLISLN